MKIIVFILILCCLYAKESKGLELADIVQALVKTGNQKDLSSLAGIVKNLFPDYFEQPSKKGNKLKSTLYTKCLYSNGPTNQLCVNLDLTLTVGWEAEQYTDNLRIYNLTIIPYADVSLDFNITLNTPVA